MLAEGAHIHARHLVPGRVPSAVDTYSYKTLCTPQPGATKDWLPGAVAGLGREAVSPPFCAYLGNPHFPASPVACAPRPSAPCAAQASEVLHLPSFWLVFLGTRGSVFLGKYLCWQGGRSPGWLQKMSLELPFWVPQKQWVCVPAFQGPVDP